jgi:hypothetical protein
MFGFFRKLSRSRLSFEQLKILQFVTQQVVISIEGSVDLPGARKKAIAIELVGQILQEMNLVVPNSLVDALIESAVGVLKALDKSLERATRPKFSLDLSGRSRSGN